LCCPGNDWTEVGQGFCPASRASARLFRAEVRNGRGRWGLATAQDPGPVPGLVLMGGIRIFWLLRPPRERFRRTDQI